MSDPRFEDSALGIAGAQVRNQILKGNDWLAAFEIFVLQLLHVVTEGSEQFINLPDYSRYIYYILLYRVF